MDKDLVLGVVAGVVLLAAMVGVFRYEGAQPAATLGRLAFDVTWSNASTNGPTAQGTTALHARSDATLHVSVTNLVSTKFTVTWKATQGKDTVKITITPPAGSGVRANGSGPADSGTLAVAFAVPNTVPGPSTVFADSEQDARARVAESSTKTIGTGDWRVTLEYVGGTGVQPVPALPPLRPDSDVSWTVASILTRYDATVRAR